MRCFGVIEFARVVLVLITFLQPAQFQKFVGKKTVTVKQGSLIGKIWKLGGTRAMVFKGVPYAEPPFDGLRFKKPHAQYNWNEKKRNALQSAPACVQFIDIKMAQKKYLDPFKKQSEDCLYLDIYAPEGRTRSLYPVIVWIHGGSYMAGSGTNQIEKRAVIRNLVRKGVILVTINYRLGIFGFVTGHNVENLGMWDQIQALRWINENIKAFGGDPSAVTVMGESAGGASASILALSPETEGLINRAIIMSGSIAARWAVDRHDRRKWDIRRIYEYLSCQRQLPVPSTVVKGTISSIANYVDPEDEDYDCPLVRKALDCSDVENDDEELLHCCMDVDFKDPDLLKLFKTLALLDFGHTMPVIDGVIIPHNISYMLKTAPRIPIMTGVAKFEWGSKLNRYPYKAKVPKDEVKQYVSRVLASAYSPVLPNDPDPSTMDLIEEETYYQYFEDDESLQLGDIDSTKLHDMGKRIESDVEFVSPCAAEAEAYVDAGQPVYLYSFEKTPNNAITEHVRIPRQLFGMSAPTHKIKRKHSEAFHGLDHGYIFTEGRTGRNYFRYDKSDRKLSNSFTTMITNFAKVGNPTPIPVDGITWSKYDPKNPKYMKIDDPMREMRQDFYWPAAQFWNREVPLLSQYSTEVQAYQEPLRDNPEDEIHIVTDKKKLSSYRQSWIALWLLITAILALLLAFLLYWGFRYCRYGGKGRMDEYYRIQNKGDFLETHVEMSPPPESPVISGLPPRYPNHTQNANAGVGVRGEIPFRQFHINTNSPARSFLHNTVIAPIMQEPTPPSTIRRAPPGHKTVTTTVPSPPPSPRIISTQVTTRDPYYPTEYGRHTRA